MAYLKKDAPADVLETLRQAEAVGGPTVGGVDFDGRRFDRREPPGEGARQGRLDRKGGSVLNHDVREPGDRKGTWSLSVTRNWRLTFGIGDDEIIDLNLEDYH